MVFKVKNVMRWYLISVVCVVSFVGPVAAFGVLSVVGAHLRYCVVAVAFMAFPAFCVVVVVGCVYTYVLVVGEGKSVGRFVAVGNCAVVGFGCLVILTMWVVRRHDAKGNRRILR